ncbi:uncharacterized protein RCO7_09049 [Rhynchosporium graminicola]|uniref:Uncharacterized protein n=1 Tax=Rhynchosporium graminicola TaxID=2792576 RepID=A0A1E1LPE9_9HELO|nr:uncharacterized protein RCO7_09049 [Rhynchosporium commune]
MFLANSQTRERIPWVAAICALFLIWSFFTLRVNTKPFTVARNEPPPDPIQPLNHNAGPIPKINATRPRYTPFADQALHEKDPKPYVSERPLILYAFFDTKLARENLRFYIKHALHDAADFLFIFNGDTNAEHLLPVAGNIRWLKRENKCFDLGAFAEVLLENGLYLKYKKYITMNASIRGPFLPHWSTGCWSDMYLSKVTNETKLVGMTMNCHIRPHIQSMIWAYDRTTIDFLLFPSAELVTKYQEILHPYIPDPYTPVPNMTAPGINSCPDKYWDAVAIEVYAAGLVKAAGYKVDAMMMAYHAGEVQRGDYTNGQECFKNADTLGSGRYYGIDIHPFDTVFAKTNRGIAPKVLERMTEWTDASGYSSYDHCSI